MVIEPFLEPAELAEWKSAVLEAVAERGSQSLPDSEHLLRDDDHDQEQRSYYEGIFTQRINLWQTNLRVRRLMLDARLGKFAAELANVEGIRIWHDQALFKPNTVYLSSEHGDGVFGSLGGLGPVAVLGSLDAVAAHLAFDDARVGTQTARREDFEEELPEGSGAGVSQGVRGKSPGATPLCGAPPGGSG